jgi:transposase
VSRKIRRPASPAIGATGHERFVAPGRRAGREVTAGALSVIRQVRRRQECRGHGFAASVTGPAAPPADGIEPRGVSHAGR